MVECHYPGLKRRTSMYFRLLNEGRNYYSQYDYDADEFSANTIFEFLFNWFAMHTSNEDKKLVIYLNKQGASDDLTRMARAYVITHNPIYKQYFQNILDIRDGKISTPNAYDYGVYWDTMISEGKPLHPSYQAAIPLLEKIRLANFSKKEFALLEKSKANSDALSTTELEAMRLADKAGHNKVLQKRAEQMLYDNKYYLAKTAIMKPIDKFYGLMDKRTLAAVDTAEHFALVIRICFIALGLLLIFLLWRTYASLMQTLGGTVSDVHTRISKIGRGDLSSSIPVMSAAVGSVLGWVEETREKLCSLDAARSESERKIQRLSDFYAALSQCNQAIVSWHSVKQFFANSPLLLLQFSRWVSTA